MHTEFPPDGQGIFGCGLRVASFGLWVAMRVAGYVLRYGCG